ncbi:hypothetical protein [Tannerella sp.]|uniref:hypothetical protein n=1 Tax=Tannerella sp. TaxID=2382127 RepID=UPI0026DD5741|nr:hypothetical protein [Tannerella sp.]MDO4704482.1 hypothetical protein [Tannerella sp.]
MAKRFFLTLICMGSFWNVIHAQDVFSKGQNNLNLGVVVGNLLDGDEIDGIPTLTLSYERCIIDGLINGKASVGVGAYASFITDSNEEGYGPYKFKYRWNDWVVGTRGAFHYQFVKRLDTYAGLMLGVNIATTSVTSKNKEIDSDLIPETKPTYHFAHSEFIGARYYFSDKLAAFAETGYRLSAFHMGVSFKF